MLYFKLALSLMIFAFMFAIASPVSAVDTPAMSAPAVKVVDHPKFGKILTDSKGMTLYQYKDDKNGVSACTDQCATNWPAFTVTSGKPVAGSDVVGNLGVITRTDKTQQVTYNGVPLYYFAKDTKPGDVNGQGIKDKWFVVSPVAK